jgi:hypothetical protein
LFQVLVIKTLDSELDLDPNPDPQLEKCWIRIRSKSMRIRNSAFSVPNVVCCWLVISVVEL